MLNRKPLLAQKRWHDIMKAISQEYESGIDVPEDLERDTLEIVAACSRVGRGISTAAAVDFILRDQQSFGGLFFYLFICLFLI